MNDARRLVLDDPIPFDRAVALVRANVEALPPEDVALADAYGRVLAEAVTAAASVPAFDGSIVDGFAVRAEDVRGATPERPAELRVAGEIFAGGGDPVEVTPGTAARIMTGAPLPRGADAVVMLEWTAFTAEQVRVERAVEPGALIRRAGEDIAVGDTALAPGGPLGAAEVGVLASLGIPRVGVFRRPAVCILATGDELIGVEEEPGPGRVRSSNSWTLAGQAREAGAVVRDLGIARDDAADLAAKLRHGTEGDVLITSGGVSVGDRDEVQRVLLELGFQRVFWRVAASPGKPLLFGTLDGTVVFGLPGNPVSSMVAFENFVRPALRRMQGDRRPERPRVRATLADDISGPADRRHFARVRVAFAPAGFIASEVRPHGSGNLRSMANANALAVLPEGVGRAPRGESVEVILLGDPDPEHTVART